MIAALPVALTVSPARLVVAAGGSAAIEVTNRGTSAATIVASTAGYAVSLRGRPGVARARAFVVVRPQRVSVEPGATALLHVATSSARLEPGDHASLVLVSSRPPRRAVGVGVRIGVVVLARGAGRIVHRLVPLGLNSRGPHVELSLRNDGNVSERLTPSNVRVRFLPRGRASFAPRELLPHSRGVLRLRTRIRAPVAAIVRVFGRTIRLKVAGRR